jgi:predicted metal-dependent enzyme (double-stranded beta helix superfamily)
MPSGAATPLHSSRELDRRELHELAADLGARPDLWREHMRHDVGERYYVQLHRDPHVDIWLICWSGGQETGLHDHDRSSGAVHVCEGDLVEDRLEADGAALRHVTADRPAGCTFDFDASHVHCVRHVAGTAPAVSIHVYSPALSRMGYYDVGPDGLLRRTSITYADELAAA